MSTTARRWLLAVAVVALVVYLAAVVSIALRAVDAGLVSGIDAIARFTATDSWWGITVVLVAGATFWFAASRLRPVARKRSSVPLLIGLGATTLLLGLLSYLPCNGSQAAFWAPLSWTIALFVGNVEDPFGSVDGCSGSMPLALQLARLTALLALSLGIAGIVGVLFRERIDRMRVRAARSLVVVAGLDDGSTTLLDRLRSETPRRTVVAVFVDDDASDALRDSVRSRGFPVVVTRATDGRALLPLVRSGRRRAVFGVVALYCLRADAARNLRVLRAFQEAGELLTPAATRSHAAIRIDDPWQAEYWRRQSIGSHRQWILDTTSVLENTARAVVQGLLERGTDRVAVLGDSPLAFAVLAEFAQRRRELDASRFDSTTTIPRVWAAGESAGELVQQHRLRQQRFGNGFGSGESSFSPEALEGRPDWAALDRALGGAVAPAVVVADAAMPSGFASSLAARKPEWAIFAYDPVAHGVPVESLMGLLFSFGPLLEPAAGSALTSWERVARIAHANYVHDDRLTGRRNEGPSGKPWNELSSFYRSSNLRLITTTLASAAVIGRSWTAEPPGGERAVDMELSDDERRAMAQLEHESWLAHYRRHGWTAGHERSDDRRVHPWLVPWSDLPPEARQRSERTVLDALALLAALGYHAVDAGAVGDPDGVTTAAGDGASGTAVDDGEWHAFRRTGTVSAVPVAEGFRWQNQNGDTMLAAPGDWRVEDSAGSVWSVADAEFRASHSRVGDSTWKREGIFFARRGRPGERVHTLEGFGSVAPGDWVVRGSSGEVWSVSASQFEAGYEAID
jgi:hypothetical protein